MDQLMTERHNLYGTLKHASLGGLTAVCTQLPRECSFTWQGAGMSRMRPRCGSGLPQFHRTSQRLSTLCVVLGLFTFLAASGPHRVHHLGEIAIPGEHHSHDRPAQELPDCPVLFLTQHTPVAESGPPPLVAPVPAAERIFLQWTCRLPECPWYGFQTRSPPA